MHNSCEPVPLRLSSPPLTFPPCMGVIFPNSGQSVSLYGEGRRGVVMFSPCLFCPSDNLWRSRDTDAHRCSHFSTVIRPPWITQQISEDKCVHQGASASQERQTMFKIVTWTKQTWTKHHYTEGGGISYFKKGRVPRDCLLRFFLTKLA